VASRSAAPVRSGRTVTLSVPLTAAGRRLLSGSAARPSLRATVTFRSAVGSTATLARTFALGR
jgi:hypothetical protein